MTIRISITLKDYTKKYKKNNTDVAVWYCRKYYANKRAQPSGEAGGDRAITSSGRN